MFSYEQNKKSYSKTLQELFFFHVKVTLDESMGKYNKNRLPQIFLQPNSIFETVSGQPLGTIT